MEGKIFNTINPKKKTFLKIWVIISKNSFVRYVRFLLMLFGLGIVFLSPKNATAQPGYFDSPWEEQSFTTSVNSDPNQLMAMNGNGGGTSKFCDPTSKHYNPEKCEKHGGGSTDVPLDSGVVYLLVGAVALAIYTIKKQQKRSLAMA